MTTTDTPRTDAEILRIWKGKIAVYVSVGFAQQLERELASSNAALDQMTEDAVNLRAEVESTKLELTHSLENQVKTQAEVERLKAQLKRAVEIAEKVADEWVDLDLYGDADFRILRANIDQIRETLSHTDK